MPTRPKPPSAALLLCLCAWTSPRLAAQGPTPALAPPSASPEAFLELRVPETETFIGQPSSVELVFGIDASLEEANLIQLFQKRLDVPVQIDAPWLGRLECTSRWTRKADRKHSEDASFVLNGEVVWARSLGLRTRGQLDFNTFVYTTSFVPTCALPIELSEASMRFAIATEYRADLFGRRSPVDRIEGRAVSNRATLRIARLPEAGRPVEFIDAVGQFSCEAELEPSLGRVGQPLTLRVRVHGSGNLEQLTSPRLDWSGFHLLGVQESYRPGERSFRYEIVPEAPGDFRLPGWRLAYFDPTPPGAYRSTATGKFRVSVEPGVSNPQERRAAPNAVQLPTRVPPPATPLWPIAVSVALLLALLYAPGIAPSSEG